VNDKNDKAPLCACGCGEEVKPGNRFIRGHSNKNKKMSDETKQKLSEARIGKKASEETRKKMSEARRGENNPFYGKKMSAEHKLKLLEINLNRVVSDETRQKLSEAGKGRECTEETRRKISLANTGRKRSKEAKKRISDAKKNPSKETLEKMSIAAKNMSEETKFKIATSLMKCRTDGYCDAWSDVEFKKDLRRSACECCGITNIMCVKLFGVQLSNHHNDGDKMNCDPFNVKSLCSRCHLLADAQLRRNSKNE